MYEEVDMVNKRNNFRTQQLYKAVTMRKNTSKDQGNH